MKRTFFFCITMLFFCIYSVSDVSARVKTGGDYLVEIGELELRKGKEDVAATEFYRALLIEPNHEKARQYLEALGYEKSTFSTQPIKVNQQFSARHRMQMIESEMNRIEAQRHEPYVQMAAGKGTCPDYFENVDERAGIETLCSGVKRLIPGSWGDHSGTFSRYHWDDEDAKDHYNGKKKPSPDMKKNSSGESHSTPQQVQLPAQEQKAEGYDDYAQMADEADALDFGEAGSSEEFAQSMRPSPTGEMPGFNEEIYPSDYENARQMQGVYQLAQQYKYEEFLKDQYFKSEMEVQNRSEIVEAQHMHLVKLNEELEDSRNNILQLLNEKEKLLNHTVYEVQALRDEGYIYR